MNLHLAPSRSYFVLVNVRPPSCEHEPASEVLCALKPSVILHYIGHSLLYSRHSAPRVSSDMFLDLSDEVLHNHHLGIN